MAQPGHRSRTVLAYVWLGVGLAMVVVPTWVGWTRGTAVLAGHPATVVVGLACGLLGLVALAWAVASLVVGDRQDREGDARHPAHRTPQQLVRRARLRIILAVPALLVSVLMVVVLVVARPYAATATALAALFSQPGVVRVVDRLTWYELVPARPNSAGVTIKPTTGLVFSPGARVDPRAYAAVLRPLATQGYLVVVLKEPFGFALAQPGHAQTVLDVHPEIRHWAVGGHSLGGVAAASFADEHRSVEGLVLFASYPAGKLERGDLKVTSISGELDRLTTPADVERSKADLPLSTRYVVLKGASHASFGDYGPQRGDGTPTANPAATRAAIAQATRALLASLPPPRKPK